MAKVLITGIKTYSFTKENGEVLSGAKVSYLGSKPSNLDNENGFIPMQVNVSLDILNNIGKVPGIYDLDFEMKSGKNNKPELMICGFDFIKDFDISSIYKA